jgi:hypothetical protein
MKYDIYFHGGCFDGIASAAVIRFMLEREGQTIGRLRQITYPVDQRIWKAMRFKHPTVIVDALYHPNAAIWFDHHPTAFLDAHWQKTFVADDLHMLDTASPSCTGLIVRHLTNTLRKPLPKRFHTLAKWLDITDGNIAGYFHSPKAFYKATTQPALQIHHTLWVCAILPYQQWLINVLVHKSLSAVAQSDTVQKHIKKYAAGMKATLKRFEKIRCAGNVGFIEDRGDAIGATFAAYYHHPDLFYTVRVFNERNGGWKLHAGKNPWNKPKINKHIGNFLRAHFGGGGHAYVGGAYFASKQAALNAAEIMMRYLNK